MLEDSDLGIDAVDVLTSISRAEESQITVRAFAWKRRRQRRQLKCATASRVLQTVCPRRRRAVDLQSAEADAFQ